MRGTRYRWWSPNRPAKARSNAGSLSRSRPTASAASVAGAAGPATRPASIARADTPVTSEATEPSLMLAASSVFWRRLTCALRSSISAVR